MYIVREDPRGHTGPAQPVRLVRLWPDQYSEVTLKIILAF